MTTTDRLGRRPLIEVLYAKDCPHYPATLGSVRVDGRDVEGGSEPATEYLLVGCRLYRLEHRFAGQPEDRWIRETLLQAAGRS